MFRRGTFLGAWTMLAGASHAWAEPPRPASPSQDRAPVLSPTGVAPDDSERADRAIWRGGTGQLVREGAFLRNRRGRLVRVESEWVYLFDADAEGRAEPPMVMQPCRRLREMQQALERRAGTLTFQTTGEVFAFDGRNHFLPTFFSVIAIEPVNRAPTTPTPQNEGGTAARSDPSAADLLREMTEPARTTAPTRALGGIGEGGAERTAEIREGASIVSRRGRVVRDGGTLTFVSDNDDAGRSLPPMNLMPCMNLEAIDRLLRRRGAGSLFIISGRVFAHEGRNHLLPTFFQIERDREGNLVPAQ